MAKLNDFFSSPISIYTVLSFSILTMHKSGYKYSFFSHAFNCHYFFVYEMEYYHFLQFECNTVNRKNLCNFNYLPLVSMLNRRRRGEKWLRWFKWWWLRASCVDKVFFFICILLFFLSPRISPGMYSDYNRTVRMLHSLSISLCCLRNVIKFNPIFYPSCLLVKIMIITIQTFPSLCMSDTFYHRHAL